LTSALVKGDPNELSIVVDSAKSVLAGMLPGRKSNGEPRQGSTANPCTPSR
jgi:hypothetical protein